MDQNTPAFQISNVGRRRKLSPRTMSLICQDFYNGETISELAETWGVSVSLIRTIVYHTPRKSDLEKKKDSRG